MIFCIAGKNDIAVNALEYLLNEKKVKKSDILICCNRNENGANSWQKSLRYFSNYYGVREIKLEEAYSLENLIFLSLEFDQIIDPKKFSTNKLFNIHFSLLPKYKGMYTSVLPIINNETESGVTFHKIDNGIDTGDIIDQVRYVIKSSDTARDIYCKNIKYGTELIKKVIDKYFFCGFDVQGVPQSVIESTYYSRKSIDFSNITLDINQTAQCIYNQIRAFNFREYQLPYFNNKPIRYATILKTRSNMKPGQIYYEDDRYCIVSSIDYDLVFYYDCFDYILTCCKNNDIEALRKIDGLEYYVNEKNDKGWTPLIVSTFNGFYEISLYLISKGADIFVKNINGTNLLMYAKDCYVNTGNSQLFEYLYSKGLSIYEKDYSFKSLSDYCKIQNIQSIGSIKI